MDSCTPHRPRAPPPMLGALEHAVPCTDVLLLLPIDHNARRRRPRQRRWWRALGRVDQAVPTIRSSPPGTNSRLRHRLFATTLVAVVGSGALEACAGKDTTGRCTVTISYRSGVGLARGGLLRWQFLAGVVGPPCRCRERGHLPPLRLAPLLLPAAARSLAAAAACHWCVLPVPATGCSLLLLAALGRGERGREMERKRGRKRDIFSFSSISWVGPICNVGSRRSKPLDWGQNRAQG